MPRTLEQRERKRARVRGGAVCAKCGGPKPSGYTTCATCREGRGVGPVQGIPRLPSFLPVRPLIVLVERFVGTYLPEERKTALEVLGLDDRRYYEWRYGRSVSASLAIVDRVLTALGLDFRDVWGRDEYPEVNARLDAIDALGEAPCDGWCPECGEPVASWGGRCVWHPVPVDVEPYLESEAA